MDMDAGFESQARPLLSIDDREFTDDDNDDPQRVRVGEEACPSLSMPLWILYGLDGMDLALPMTALLYLVNDHVQIPLSLLPSYASLSFLPCSLKPLYAAVSDLFAERMRIPRSAQISVLLTLSAASCVACTFIPPRAVVWCFVLAFVRCFWSSWPEFLLGITLIDEAVAYETLRKRPLGQQGHTNIRLDNSYAETAALFQSQAAMARSIGSMVAHLMVLLFFGVIQWSRLFQPHSSPAATAAVFGLHSAGMVLNHDTMSTLLWTTAAFNLLGATIAWTCRVGQTCDATTCTNNYIDDIDDFSEPLARPDVGLDSPQHTVATCRPCYESLCGRDSIANQSSALELESDNDQSRPVHNEASSEPIDSEQDEHEAPGNGPLHVNLALVVVLQVTIVVFTLRQPVMHASAIWCWNAMALLAVLLLLTVGIRMLRSGSDTRQAHKQAYFNSVGLFLILRNAVPSVSYLMSSFLYTAFASMPSFLQILSLWDMAISSASCWSYGKLFRKYSWGNQLHCLMAGTTLLAAAASLANLALIRVLNSHVTLAEKMAWAVAMKAALGFTSEWKFLPDIVLATVSVDAIASRTSPDEHESSEPCIDNGTTRTPRIGGGPNFAHNLQQSSAASVGLQYGTLVSCIDFGGQLGALLAGPLVAFVGTSRENGWAQLDTLQLVNSALMFLSIPLILLLIRSR
jgi:hypothetical protein